MEAVVHRAQGAQSIQPQMLRLPLEAQGLPLEARVEAETPELSSRRVLEASAPEVAAIREVPAGLRRLGQADRLWWMPL